jgi:hypothetical protein
VERRVLFQGDYIVGPDKPAGEDAFTMTVFEQFSDAGAAGSQAAKMSVFAQDASTRRLLARKHVVSRYSRFAEPDARLARELDAGGQIYVVRFEVDRRLVREVAELTKTAPAETNLLAHETFVNERTILWLGI